MGTSRSDRTLLALIVPLLVAGCAAAPLRLRTEDDELFAVRPRQITRVELSAVTYRAAMAVLYSSWELPAPRFQVQRASWTPERPVPEAQRDLFRGYRSLCERRGEAGDCLSLFDDGWGFSETDKRSIATRIALSEALVSAAESLQGMTAQQVEVGVLATLVLYLGLLVLPEPVSKVAVVVFTAQLIANVGLDLFFSFIQGYRELKEQSERATTFDELHEAGTRWGRLIGPSGTRLMVILATLGAGGAFGAAGGSGFPGAAQALANAESQGFLLSAAGTLTTVQVGAGGSSVIFGVGAGAAIAPWVLREAGEATGDERPRGFRSFSAFKRARGTAGTGKEWHHIVEKTPGNVERFGAEKLHHDENLIAMDAEAHRKISAFYSSRQWLKKGETIRDWLSTQPYAAQREFGLRIMKRFGVTP